MTFDPVIAHFKFTKTVDDSWMTRSIFPLSSDSVVAYKFWMERYGRPLRGIDKRLSVDFKFAFEL